MMGRELANYVAAQLAKLLVIAFVAGGVVVIGAAVLSRTLRGD